MFIDHKKDLKTIIMMFTQTALSNNDDKRLQTFDGITTYPWGTNVFKICESEMLMVKDLFFEKLK